MSSNYFLGLDMGTGSTGWAVTNQQYEIQRAHWKALWGVRLFDTANTAEERRRFRTSRRRLARRNQRIRLLQEIFAEEINRVDDGFFLRMKESRYLPEDKHDTAGKCPDLPYALFVDSDYTDKDYHEQFPTIYHLRKWLMETKDTPDIRLIYLAFHHMIKHRGHFLLSGDINTVKEFQNTFDQFMEVINSEGLDFQVSITAEDRISVEQILKDTSRTRTSKKSALIKKLGARTACEKALLTLISGCKVKLKDIFGDEEMGEWEKSDLSFSDNNYDDYEAEIETELGERFDVIQMAKVVYDWSVLADILGDSNSVSEAKVATYEKHKSDLAYLKKLVRDQLGHEAYQKIFVKTDTSLNNYPAYIGMTKKNGRKQPLAGKKCSKEDFYSFLRKEILAKGNASDQTEYLKEELEKGMFLPRQRIKDNGVFPNQVHLYELDQIFANLRERVPLLKENEEKIRKLLTFHIPYYVGPLNGITKKDGGKTNWAVRKSTGTIYPWNFEDMIDTDKSAEQFIRRMTNKCTYLNAEDVLPKNSLLYSKFMVLNELNNLRLNGEKISVELKQKIYEDLFCRYRKVTQKRLHDYLVREGITDRNVDITGIDGDFKGSLTAYHDFKEKLTGCSLSQEEKESIILDITLFGEDKTLLKRRLKAQFPKLTDGQIKALCSLSYRGWGRFSEEFLCEITAPSPETGEIWNVITALWETNDNLMQLLSEKYQFAQSVEEWNSADEPKEFSYQMVEELAVSPAVKRQIWQTLQIVKEICKVMGEPPQRVFIEMAREKQESVRKESRKTILLDLYKNCKAEERDWIEELNNTEEYSFRSDRLYLYYTQKGQCMYTGEVISLEDLWNKNKYDIDHIYPRSKVMDDSLDNRVLVKMEYNRDTKKDIYPIPEDIRQNRKPYWKMLLDGGFISKEKYYRLTRASGFEPEELAGFISRQLVETRQGTKAVASILKQLLPETEIVYAKANAVTKFRQKFDLIKVRELNDFHHAKDAYLNIVVGNTYYIKFTKNASWFIKEHPGRSYNLEEMFTSKDVERNGEIAWKAGNEGTIVTVRRVMNKNNILVTRRAYEAKGELFNQQLVKKGKGQVPIKENEERLKQIDKYGGYNSVKGTYFMLVESDDRKEGKKRTIEYVPLYLKNKIEMEGGAVEYLQEQLGLKNPRILLPEIKIDTLFKVNGFHMWLSSRHDSNRLKVKCAEQLLLPQDDVSTLKKVLKFVQRRKENKNIKLTSWDSLEEEELIDFYDKLLSKAKNTIYHIFMGELIKNLTEKRERYQTLCNEDKCIVLSEILHCFQCQSAGVNLKLLGGPENAGRITISKNIKNYKQISIINQSPTGIYENEIDLLKL